MWSKICVVDDNLFQDPESLNLNYNQYLWFLNFLSRLLANYMLFYKVKIKPFSNIYYCNKNRDSL